MVTSRKDHGLIDGIVSVGIKISVLISVLTVKFEIPVIPEREIKTCKITTKQMRDFLIFPYSLLLKPILDFISNRENS